MPRRCAFGCVPNYKMRRHKFPHPQRNLEQLKAWVAALGAKLETEEDYKLYRNISVCDVHFTSQDMTWNNRLSAIAVPSLYLKGKQSDTPPQSPGPLSPVKLECVERTECPIHEETISEMNTADGQMVGTLIECPKIEIEVVKMEPPDVEDAGSHYGDALADHAGISRDIG